MPRAPQDIAMDVTRGISPQDSEEAESAEWFALMVLFNLGWDGAMLFSNAGRTRACVKPGGQCPFDLHGLLERMDEDAGNDLLEATGARLNRSKVH